MSRASIRAAVGDYLSNAGVTNLSKVYTQPPKFTDAGEFFSGQDPGHASGAVIYLHIPNQNENRQAIGGATSGQKQRVYTIGLVCIFRSKKPNTQDVGDDNDAFLDSLVDAIEANRNAGNPNVVWQWGEGEELYGVDIKVQAEMPRPMRLQMSQVFSVVQVTVVEQLST